MKIQNWTKVFAMLLLTGVLVGCDQGGSEVETVDPVGTVEGVDGDALPADDDTTVVEEVEVE